MSGGVEARFYVANVGLSASGPGTIKLNASTKGDYKSWSLATPFGSIDLGCLNEAATAWFRDRLGKDIAVVFCDPPEAES